MQWVGFRAFSLWTSLSNVLHFRIEQLSIQTGIPWQPLVQHVGIVRWQL